MRAKSFSSNSKPINRSTRKKIITPKDSGESKSTSLPASKADFSSLEILYNLGNQTIKRKEKKSPVNEKSFSLTRLSKKGFSLPSSTKSPIKNDGENLALNSPLSCEYIEINDGTKDFKNKEFKMIKGGSFGEWPEIGQLTRPDNPVVLFRC